MANHAASSFLTIKRSSCSINHCSTAAPAARCRQPRQYNLHGGAANKKRVLVRAKHQHSADDVALQRLGLRQGASPQDVKQAYRKLALRFHPDVCKEDSCSANFMQINNAYEVIMQCFQGEGDAYNLVGDEPFVGESMMGVYDGDWEEWEEWMGWEGAATLDYSNHINQYDS